MRIRVLKNWAGFAGAWATACAIAVAVHAGGAGGMKLLGAAHSEGMAREFKHVSQSQALRVRLEATSQPMDLLKRPSVPQLLRSDRSLGAGSEQTFADMESNRADGLSPAGDAIEVIDVVDVTDGSGASSAAEGGDAGPEGIEECTTLSSLISRELWLEFRDYGILPRTYKVAYARGLARDTQLVRFEPVNAARIEYADRMLSGILQGCLSDLKALPSQGDFEVTFVIGDE